LSIAVTGNLDALGHVLTAESLDEAHQRVASLSALAPYQSVITRSGEWLGPGWARVRRAQGSQVGVLAREREIRLLAEQIDALEAQLEASSEQLDTLRTRKFEAERARDDAQRELYNAHRRQSELAGQLQSHRGKRRRELSWRYAAWAWSGSRWRTRGATSSMKSFIERWRFSVVA